MGNHETGVKSSSTRRLYSFLNDDRIKFQTLRDMNSEIIEVVYKHIKDEELIQVSINISVAFLTTCWERLKLYREGLSYLKP